MAWSQQKKTEPAKVVVWGIGEDYDNVYNSIELQILKNNIEIVAFCCREVDKISPTFEENQIIIRGYLEDFKVQIAFSMFSKYTQDLSILLN